MGRLIVLLKDAPAEVDELWITITDLELHRVGNDESEGVGFLLILPRQ